MASKAPLRASSTQIQRSVGELKPVITEVRVVRTAYGMAKHAEVGNKGALRLAPLPANVRLVPYLEHKLICGVYLVDPSHAQEREPKVTQYPIIDTIPFFLLDDTLREEMLAQLKHVEGNFRVPEEHDLTATVRAVLEQSEVLSTARPDSSFDLAQFVAEITGVRSSDQFKDIYLFSTQSGRRWIMTVDQILEQVIDLHPYFVQLNQPEAVRIRYRDSETTWLAPLGQAQSRPPS